MVFWRLIAIAGFIGTPLLTGLFLTGCSALPATTTSETSVAAPSENLRIHRIPDNLHWMRNSTEYPALAAQIFRAAAQRLEELAVVREEVGAWAIAVDADETLISNLQYQKERAEIGQGYSSESWGEWVERREATRVPGALAFLQRARELGGKIAVVTNRREAHCPATRDNLEALDLPFDVVLCRPESTGEKEPRWQAVEEGSAAPELGPLEIVMWVGDNITDFPDLDQGLRGTEEQAFELFGRRYFVIPNTAYGSWEDNPRR